MSMMKAPEVSSSASVVVVVVVVVAAGLGSELVDLIDAD